MKKFPILFIFLTSFIYFQLNINTVMATSAQKWPIALTNSHIKSDYMKARVEQNVRRVGEKYRGRITELSVYLEEYLTRTKDMTINQTEELAKHDKEFADFQNIFFAVSSELSHIDRLFLIPDRDQTSYGGKPGFIPHKGTPPLGYHTGLYMSPIDGSIRYIDSGCYWREGDMIGTSPDSLSGTSRGYSGYGYSTGGILPYDFHDRERKADEEAKRKADEEAKRKADEEMDLSLRNLLSKESYMVLYGANGNPLNKLLEEDKIFGVFGSGDSIITKSNNMQEVGLSLRLNDNTQLNLGGGKTLFYESLSSGRKTFIKKDYFYVDVIINDTLNNYYTLTALLGRGKTARHFNEKIIVKKTNTHGARLRWDNTSILNYEIFSITSSAEVSLIKNYVAGDKNTKKIDFQDSFLSLGLGTTIKLHEHLNFIFKTEPAKSIKSNQQAWVKFTSGIQYNDNLSKISLAINHRTTFDKPWISFSYMIKF